MNTINKKARTKQHPSTRLINKCKERQHGPRMSTKVQKSAQHIPIRAQKKLPKALRLPIQVVLNSRICSPPIDCSTHIQIQGRFIAELQHNTKTDAKKLNMNGSGNSLTLSLIHISEPTRPRLI
eukprot:3454507-Amphidinium_carterae.1